MRMRGEYRMQEIAALESLVLSIVQANKTTSVDKIINLAKKFSEEDTKYVIRRLVERGVLKFNDDMLLECVG